MEEKSLGLQESRHRTARILKEMIAILTRTPGKRRAGKLGVKITAIDGMWTSLSEGITGLAKMPVFRGSTSQATRPLKISMTRHSSTMI